MEWYWWVLLGLVILGVLGLLLSSKDKSESIQKVGNFLIQRDGTLIDERTGLMWIKDGDCAFTAGVPLNLKFNMGINWFQACDFISELNRGKFQGRLSGHNYRDWRLPTIEEMDKFLSGITYDIQGILPNIRTVKTGTSFKYYWTSTESSLKPNDRTYAYAAKIGKTPITQPKETAFHHVWPVRKPSVSEKE